MSSGAYSSFLSDRSQRKLIVPSCRTQVRLTISGGRGGLALDVIFRYLLEASKVEEK